ncbi:UTRA domain-containing protein [Sphingobium sp. JS3065]|uniref:UTRA domain-containing protein n=1 Tax=Sphingobium sp. JS3065 TaxID=2970925 RepID=UPI002263B18B|nr:UTRA domain-containing protein [Sphingobium sp. JS3065]UZW57446.1 UTRA domain-containing protein [Sphingobium sp. JS3065]
MSRLRCGTESDQFVAGIVNKVDKIQDQPDELSLHDRIRQDIETKIMSGAWAPGHRIPYEHELMKQYDCSRMTINKALSTLVERGLIERRKRAGSFVSAPKYHRAFFDLPDLRSQMMNEGRKYDFDLTARMIREASASDRSNLNIAGGEVLGLKCTHFVDGKAYSLEDRIINLSQVPEARSAEFDHEPPSSWLFGHVPWSDARHRISAINADVEMAEALGIRQDSACMVVERWTWRVEQKITYVRNVYPGNEFSIEAQFRP